LLAAGADLSSERLLEAYRHGIFPWFSEGDPILGGAGPRMILIPAEFKISRSFGKVLRNRSYETRFDSAFDEVLAGCAAPRKGRRHLDQRRDDRGLPEPAPARIRAFGRNLDRRELVGGLYGVAIGRVFFGESMFSRCTMPRRSRSRSRRPSRIGGVRAYRLPDAHAAPGDAGRARDPQAPVFQVARRVGTLLEPAGELVRRIRRAGAMSKLNDLPHAVLQFYVTAPYPCSYLPGRMARSQVATPSHLIGTELYADLVRLGFRRSGIFTYRPYCDHCRAAFRCASRRGVFAPRAASGGLAKHAELQHAVTGLAVSRRALLALSSLSGEPAFRRRHGPGQPRPVLAFPAAKPVSTRLVEFRDKGKLMMVSIVDQLGDGFPRLHFLRSRGRRRELRHYNILWQIEQCRRASLPYLYLGIGSRTAARCLQAHFSRSKASSTDLAINSRPKSSIPDPGAQSRRGKMAHALSRLRPLLFALDPEEESEPESRRLGAVGIASLAATECACACRCGCPYPITEIEIGQGGAAALLDLPQDVVGAEARAGGLGS